MKNLLKLESAGLFLLFTGIYFHFYPYLWGVFLAAFFLPDLSFVIFLISKKAGTFAYNLLHHQGFLVFCLMLGYFIKDDTLMKLSLIFLSHSTFDRVAGYGLKYADSFDHTHLGWIGKSKHHNKKIAD